MRTKREKDTSVRVIGFIPLKCSVFGLTQWRTNRFSRLQRSVIVVVCVKTSKMLKLMKKEVNYLERKTKGILR